jgi:hypothetical protein
VACGTAFQRLSGRNFRVTTMVTSLFVSAGWTTGGILTGFPYSPRSHGICSLSLAQIRKWCFLFGSPQLTKHTCHAVAWGPGVPCAFSLSLWGLKDAKCHVPDWDGLGLGI